MVLTLRPYQIDQREAVEAAWAEGHRNVLLESPTGSGKTVLFSSILADHKGAACAIAHRQELVSQIALSLARCRVRHTIIGPASVVKFTDRLEREECGRSYYDPAASIAVAGVDTLRARADRLTGWAQQVTLVVQDEAHHVLAENKWGKVLDTLPHARMLGVTATPGRADGRGLGRHHDGLFDVLIPGPGMRTLIDEGWLSEYRIFAPTTDIDFQALHVSPSTGDFKSQELSNEVGRSHLVGDVVQSYKRFADGKLGITFAVDVESASRLAEAYTAACVPAAVVTAKTPAATRQQIIRRFRAGALRQLVNVDIFGEGFDLPAIEVVSMARPTASFPLYAQQFGRALRPREGKSAAIIIDHVENVMRHRGPPDFPRTWTLDRRDGGRSKAERDIPIKICAECTSPYEAVYSGCPYCEAPYVPASRASIKCVEGDLVELDPSVLADMRREIERIDAPADSIRVKMGRAGAPAIAAAGAAKNHRLRQEAQESLRVMLDVYGNMGRIRKWPDSEIHKRFWFRYGCDVMTAQTLGRREAEALTCRLIDDLGV